MNRILTCIECPKSCKISVDIADGSINKIEGYQCPKGEKYAKTEVENPMRILTSTVLANGLGMKLVPVRTDKPIPKEKLMEAMSIIKNIKLDHRVNTGDIIAKDFITQGTNLIATRDVMIN